MGTSTTPTALKTGWRSPLRAPQDGPRATWNPRLVLALPPLDVLGSESVCPQRRAQTLAPFIHPLSAPLGHPWIALVSSSYLALVALAFAFATFPPSRQDALRNAGRATTPHQNPLALRCARIRATGQHDVNNNHRQQRKTPRAAEGKKTILVLAALPEAMAQISSPLPGHLHGHGHAKITKARSRQAVKPILKKLHSHHSHSEKNSLDLDRGWDEQGQFGYSPYKAGGDDDSHHGSYTAGASTVTTAGTGTGTGAVTRARDVSFSLSATDLSSGGVRPNKYSHARSTSGTSHASIATSASGGRNGSFVHPFQQTPRTSTPPLSYANSLASLENPNGPRDYSPTITEDDDDIEPQNLQSTARAYALPHSGSRPRRPSLASQRTSSLSDVNQPLRVTANGRSTPGITSRIPHSIVTRSRSDLHLHTGSTTALDSASSASPPTGSFISPQMIAASSSSNGMSPLRSSLDMGGFRLRSRSEVDTATRQEHVREARRKFEEKEKAKEEKYAREQIRKQERAESREAHRFNKHGRKGSFGASRISCDRASSTTDIRPTVSRKNTGTGLGLSLNTENEKVGFATRGYDTVTTGQTPRARTDDVHFQSTRRTNTAKRKTTGAWTAFVLWLRTRLLKLGRR
ncbi:hypothetical protein FDECE_4312 [Fusarium decemcellulare]|nr:hypothetical protein FDECE_4312 [Fusarium decemcellulare]